MEIIAEKAKYAAVRAIHNHSTFRPLSIHLHGIQASESKLRILVTSNAGFLTSTSTEFKLLNPSSIQAGAGLRQTSTPASSHPPPRNPSIEFWSYQSFTPVRRIRLQEIQASHFGHFNPPSTSNRRRSMRLQSHHLRVIHICCERWSRMRAHARTD